MIKYFAVIEKEEKLMILHNAGKYNGDESTLPHRENPSNAVPFKELDSMEKVSSIANNGALLTIIVLTIPFIILAKEYLKENIIWIFLAIICSNLVMPIHEFLHAICFKKDVYYYNNLKQMLMFVVGTEDMSKERFIFMTLCPNIFLGLIPYIIFLIYPHMVFVGVFGIICIGNGFGDYMNVYNAIKQVPKGAVTYLNGMHSYWYMKNK